MNDFKPNRFAELYYGKNVKVVSLPIPENSLAYRGFLFMTKEEWLQLQERQKNQPNDCPVCKKERLKEAN